MEHLPSWTKLSTGLKSALSGLSKGVQETQNEGDELYRTVRIKEISAALACHLCEVFDTFGNILYSSANIFDAYRAIKAKNRRKTRH